MSSINCDANGNWTYLRTGHQIPSASDDRDWIFLDGSRSGVHGKANVFQQERIQRRAGEWKNGLGHTSASSLDGDIIIFFKINARVLFRRVSCIAKKLLLHAQVSTSGNVFAVSPDAISESFASDWITATSWGSRWGAPIRWDMGTCPVTADSSTSRGTRECSSASIWIAAPGLKAAPGSWRGGVSAGTSPTISITDMKTPQTNKGKKKKDLPIGKWRIRSSPLHIPEVRRNISRFVETKSLWE